MAANLAVSGQIPGNWISLQRHKAGKNELEVEVVNLWVNRLIGDSRLPGNERGTWAPNNPYKPGDRLEPSGLLGPVNILSFVY